MKRQIHVATLLLLMGCSSSPSTDPRMVSELMHTMYGVLRVERVSPPVASRVMTYATSALYSGMAVTDASMKPLNGTLNAFPELPRAERPGDVDGPIVGLVAKRVVLDTLLREALPTTRAALARLTDSLEQSRVATGISEDVHARSRALGERIGQAIVGWSRTDGFAETRGKPYAIRVGPQYWQNNDAPATVYAQQNLSGASEMVEFDNPANVLQAGRTGDRSLILNRPKARGATLPPVDITGTSEPYFYQVRPFILSAWDECPLPDPPEYSTDTASAMYKEAYAVYAAKQKLTDYDKTTALYWADNAGESGTPVGHWISIASQMVNQKGLSAAEAARVMVLTAATQADAFISSFGYKYKYGLLRPRMYIRRVIDPSWEPLIPTPPFPEYPSAHSTQSAAAATVMTGVLGAMAFDDSTSMMIGHDVRRFNSFVEAGAEAGMSRIYGGIHYPIANVNGQSLGKCIGEKTIARFSGQ